MYYISIDFYRGFVGFLLFIIGYKELLWVIIIWVIMGYCGVS